LDEKKEILKKKLFEKAIKTGDFTLASGLKSTYYINGKMATLESEGLYLISEFMLDMIKDVDCDAVGGMTMGADPMVGGIIALAHNRGMNLTGFIVRKQTKDHGTQKLIEGPIEKGMKTVIIEDVATTGGSANKAIEAVKEFGCEVVKVLVIVDREQGAGEFFESINMPFEAIFTKSELNL